MNERTDPAVERVNEAIRHLAAGHMILVRDDAGRENEGDLVVAADRCRPEHIAFMARNGRGLICQSIPAESAVRLGLPPQAPVNTEAQGTAFTVSVDAVEGVTTGISAADRARTVAVLVDPRATAPDLRRPGHVFPLVARPGGVLERPGHTEASADLARLAGFSASGVICEVLNDDGTMARGPQLEELARRWGMPLLSVADLVEYRRLTGDFSLEQTPTVDLPTDSGAFRVTAYRTGDPRCRDALLLEPAWQTEPAPTGCDDGTPAPLVRLHSECLTGEALGSRRCECGPQLDAAMRAVQNEGGAIVYLRQEGRGIGLFEKLRAYALQDDGFDTVDANTVLGHPADDRHYGVAARILRERGYRAVRLMTNNPDKVNTLRAAGVAVVEQVPLHVGWTAENAGYMETKIRRMGHIARKEFAG